MAIGLLNSSQFIALSAAVEKVQLATTISTFSLAQQLGMLVGASGSAALLRMVFRKGLVKRLFDGGKDVGNLKVGGRACDSLDCVRIHNMQGFL